ncbi:hypothetical protein [Corynebacterium pyruviciproducens]|uniref:hypothetical protein n=1 Tax=Corynebacterium pyruviciproducens TaxID=598660 RepID=UPI00254FFDCE|nr:hypothetical protein [Corynebacterium pyruviciproducens]MDK7213651.1 hypothetical protein [Corynebacterium pyruviciproducens]
MRKTLLAVATASVLATGLAVPASATNWEETPRPVTLGSSDEPFQYTFGWNEEKPWNLDATTVVDPSDKLVCDSQNPAVNDFMFTSHNGRCEYKTPLQVIKDITAYITTISGTISAVLGVLNTATNFVK